MITRVVIKGGVGSGHRGHRGRPGKRGGSLPGTGVGSIADLERIADVSLPPDDENYSYFYHSVRHDSELDSIEKTGLRVNDAGIIYASKDEIRSRGSGFVIFRVPKDTKMREAVDVVEIGLSFREFRIYENISAKHILRAVREVSIKGTQHTIREDELASYAIGHQGDLEAADLPLEYQRWFTLEKQLTVTKGGPGSGHRGHRGRPGKRGGSLPEGGGSTGKVWQGEQQTKPEEKLSKLKTGATGEELAMRALEEKLGAKFSTLNNGVNNAPIDVGGNHHAIEVKTGLASNGRTAQHWRATIGQPGKKETELIKQMSKEEKKAHHTWKKQKILERKNTALREMEKVANAEIEPATVGVILSPDGKRGDVYFIPGFHLRLPWKDYAIDKYHIGTYDVGEFKEYFKGGPGSGHRGHRGRPGKRGGSLPSSVGVGRTNPSNPDEKALMEYLNQVAGLRKGQKPEGFVYAGMEDLVLKHGRFFEPPKKGDKLPEGCDRGAQKECFRNAIMNRSDELIYTEGYATTDLISGFGFEHAWLTTLDGKVVDPTWESGHGLSYFGVRLNGDFVLKTTLKTEVAGIIVNDWMTGAKLMRKGFPEDALWKEE